MAPGNGCDGLHPQRVLISHALDCEAMADLFDGSFVDQGTQQELRDLIIALSKEPGPLVGARCPGISWR